MWGAKEALSECLVSDMGMPLGNQQSLPAWSDWERWNLLATAGSSSWEFKTCGCSLTDTPKLPNSSHCPVQYKCTEQLRWSASPITVHTAHLTPAFPCMRLSFPLHHCPFFIPFSTPTQSSRTEPQGMWQGSLQVPSSSRHSYYIQISMCLGCTKTHAGTHTST